MGSVLSTTSMLRHLIPVLVSLQVASACFSLFPPAPPPPPPTTTTTTQAPTTVPVSSCQCGRANKVQRIVGGVQAEENEYPWQVGLISRQSSSTPFCGGTLISNTEILTAAHCTQSGVNWVLLGEHDLTKADGEQRLQVCSVKDHPSYNPSTLDNDFSILTLCNPVTFQTDIQPACLPPSTSYVSDNREAVVSGWGTLSSGGSQPTILHEVTLQTMTNAQCTGSSTVYSSGSITNQMLCASATGKDSCQGDSGGPLVTAESEGYYTLIGVVSWGIGCAQSNAPGVYGRVTSVLPWIQDNMSGSTCPTRSRISAFTEKTNEASNLKIF